MKTCVSPVLGSLSIDVLDTPLVLRVLRPIWQSEHVTAKRVQQRIEAVLDWAKTQGFREGANPAQWKGHLSSELLTWLAPTLEVVDLFAVGGAHQYMSGFFLFARRTSENMGTLGPRLRTQTCPLWPSAAETGQSPAALCQEF